MLHKQVHLDKKATISSVQNLALALLQCNRTVSEDASGTFYSKNTFLFEGDHDWAPIASWLEAIGERNCSHLTNLAASVGKLPRSWQFSDGSRVPVKNFYFEGEIYPQNLHFSKSDNLVQGEVENINPVIETIFSTLSRCKHNSTSKLLLTLNLDSGLIPGIIPQQGSDTIYFSMDLPNLMEKWRVDYTSKDNGTPMEVLWKTRGFRDKALDKRELMKEQAWEILAEEEIENTRFPQLAFTLRRRPLEGPLVPSNPSPWSFRFGPDTYSIGKKADQEKSGSVARPKLLRSSFLALILPRSLVERAFGS